MLRRADAGWPNPKVLAILAVIFLCGVAFGSVISSLYLHARMTTAPRQYGMDAAQHVGLQHLKAALQLTPEQEKIVTKELDDYAKYYQNIEDEREDVAEHGRRRILDVLTPQQRKKFNDIFGSPPQ